MIYMAAYLQLQNRTVQSAKIPRKPNEIAVEWLESKDAGMRHRETMKHIIGKLEEVKVGGEAIVKLNSRRGRTEIIDLLTGPPTPPPQKKRSAKTSIHNNFAPVTTPQHLLQHHYQITLFTQHLQHVHIP